MLANQVSQAKVILRHGGVVAYSTETVLGLGCDPNNENAVNRILWLKNRAIENGLIILVTNINSLQQYTPTLSDTQVSEIEPAQNTTWLVPANENAPKWITGRHTSIAIRISHHPVVQQLCNTKNAIVSTSANISAYKTLKNRAEIWNWFGPHVDYVMIDTDAIGSGRSSEIRDLLSGKKLR